MAKSRGFSIFLLKTGFSNANALKDDHNLEIILEGGANLPDGSTMYIANRPGSPPWWKNYWGITKDLFQIQKGALLFLSLEDRWVVLTFGMTQFNLKDECYEYDFGLRTTLNALDPDKIKSTDILMPENARRQSIQSPTASNLNFFDIRHDESIIKKLTGAVKPEYQNLFRNATGATSLRISSKLPANEITELCKRLVEIYEKDDFEQSFPDIQNIVPVKDPSKLEKLHQKLLEAFKDAPIELVLSIPEIIDYSNFFKIKYKGAGRSNTEYNDVFIGDYRNYLHERGVNEVENVDTFYKHYMTVIDENDLTIKQYNIYKSFLYDCEVEGGTFHLCEGEWYQINTEYIQKLRATLNPYFLNAPHNYLHNCSEKREDDYNVSVSDAHAQVICLDKKNISPNGQTAIEPCDLITIDNGALNLIHVKISTRSSSLSHLFNQGVNSIELLRMEVESRDKLKELVNDESMSQYIDNGNFSVTYGIITKKNGLSEKLPLFSCISLLRAVNSLRMMNIQCNIFYIFDNVNRKDNVENE